MQGKDCWWCDGCNKEVPQTEAYWLIVPVITSSVAANLDGRKSIIDSGGKPFEGGDFCDECVQKMAGAIERER